MKENNWKLFLTVDLHTKFIKIFQDIFLGIYLLKIDNGNVTNVCVYYITLCLSNMLFFYLVNKIQKRNLMQLLRIGMFLTLVQCLILLITGETITKYIIPFAIFSSIANAFYYYPHPLIVKILNKQSNFQKYCTYDRVSKDIIGILFPTIFGVMISAKSYSLVFLLLLAVTFISFILSFKLANVEFAHQPIDLHKLYKNLKTNQKLNVIRLMSKRSFFRGLSSFGVLSTLITILTYLTVKTEASVGWISSLITIIGAITVFLVNKYFSRKMLANTFIPLAIVQAFIVIGLTFSMIYLDLNKVIIGMTLGYLIILVYNIVNGIVNPIFEVANETVYYENMNTDIIDTKLHSSYTYFFEVAINIPRILGYVILLIVSSFGFTVNNISILICALSMMYIAFAYTLRKLES